MTRIPAVASLHRPVLAVRGSLRVILLLLAVGATLIAAWLFVKSGSFALTRIGSPDVAYHLDFDTFWRSAVALLDGRSIYQTEAPYPNLNPPLMTVVLAPIGLLDFFPAYRLFLLISVALFVGCMVAVATELRISPGPAIAITAAALVSSPVLGTLGLGQIYSLLSAGIVVAWIAARRGREMVAAVALGSIVALKPSLGVLLLLPALHRRWTALGVTVGAACFGTLLGSFIAGRSSFSEWSRIVSERPVQTYFDNASLPVTILRLTSPTGWGTPLTVIRGGFAMGCILAVTLIVITAWRIHTSSARPGTDTELWALTAASLLLSPITWHNYLMLLLPGLLVLTARGKWPTATLLLGSAMIGMEWPPMWYVNGAASAVPLSLYCAILVVYWLAFVVDSAGSAHAPAVVQPDSEEERADAPTAERDYSGPGEIVPIPGVSR